MSAAENRSVLWDDHRAYLDARAVDPGVADERRYFSVETKAAIQRMGFGVKVPAPAMVVPLWSVTGECDGYQLHPDNPRVSAEGRPLKFEVPHKYKPRLDVHPRSLAALADPSVPLWITEGIPKGDALVSAGVAAVSLVGVWNWLGDALADFEYLRPKGRTFYVAFDSDVMLKVSVHAALERLGNLLTQRGATVAYVYLPDGPNGRKQGVDDYLAAGGTIEDLLARHTTTELRRTAWTDDGTPEDDPPEPVEPTDLASVVATFRRHLRLDDLAPVYVVLGTYAANLLDGDPVWVMVVGGSGRGKTEVVSALTRCPGVVSASSIKGEASLLSATPSRERSTAATGGLLRQIGDRGLLVLKDFTSILSMSRDPRAEVLGALREVFDGYWSRSVGAEGGYQLTWRGKAGVVAGCTTAIDSAHAVMSTMGERFLMVRMPETDGEPLARAALAQGGHETAMRAELATAVAGLFVNGLPRTPTTATATEVDLLVTLADFASRARSPVQRDARGDIELVLDREAPTRIVKALERLWAGLDAIGLDRAEGWNVIRRVGLDVIPKLRRAVLEVLALHGGWRPPTDEDSWMTTTEVASAVDHPTRTVRRSLEDLEAHGVVDREAGGEGKADRWALSRWAGQRWEAITTGTVPEMSEHPLPPVSGVAVPNTHQHTCTDIPGKVTSPSVVPIHGCRRCGDPAGIPGRHSSGQMRCTTCWHNDEVVGQ